MLYLVHKARKVLFSFAEPAQFPIVFVLAHVFHLGDYQQLELVKQHSHVGAKLIKVEEELVVHLNFLYCYA